MEGDGIRASGLSAALENDYDMKLFYDSLPHIDQIRIDLMCSRAYYKGAHDTLDKAIERMKG